MAHSRLATRQSIFNTVSLDDEMWVWGWTGVEFFLSFNFFAWTFGVHMKYIFPFSPTIQRRGLFPIFLVGQLLGWIMLTLR